MENTSQEQIKIIQFSNHGTQLKRTKILILHESTFKYTFQTLHDIHPSLNDSLLTVIHANVDDRHYVTFYMVSIHFSYD